MVATQKKERMLESEVIWKRKDQWEKKHPSLQNNPNKNIYMREIKYERSDGPTMEDGDGRMSVIDRSGSRCPAATLGEMLKGS
jgi:hypothetical protein